MGPGFRDDDVTDGQGESWTVVEVQRDTEGRLVRVLVQLVVPHEGGEKFGMAWR